MISYTKAITEIKKNIKQSNKKEFVNLSLAIDRILAENIYANHYSPISNVSSMDGAIVRKIDLHNNRNRFKIVGESKAGDFSTADIKKNETKFVYTGGPVPGKNKIVIPKENFKVHLNEKMLEIVLESKTSFIRKKGQDFKINDLCIKKGDILNIRKLALAKALKKKELLVLKRPNVVVIISGDEIKSKTNPKGLIESSNKVLIVNLLNKLGCNTLGVYEVMDNKTELQRVLNSLNNFDFLITSGGISKGRYDIIKSTLENFNLQIIFDSVKVKPGKPVTFGVLNKNKFFLGAPGNPVSCFITIIFFFTRMLNSFYGQTKQIFNYRTLISSSSFKISNKFTNFLRIKLSNSEKKFYIFKDQDSSLLKVLSESDGILVARPKLRTIISGEKYEVILFKDIFNFWI